MRNKKSFLFPAIAGWALLAVFACILIVHGDWIPASTTPPGGNPSAPINLSSSSQTKLGALTLNNALTVAGASLFQNTLTLTPTANNTDLLKVTNATGTELLKIDSTNGTSTLSGGGTSVALSSTGAAIGNLTIGTDEMIFGSVSGYKLGIGANPSTDNLEISGTAHASGNIKSTTGFCIGASCITEWPTSAPGSGVPQSGMILSETSTNPLISTAGYTLFEQAPNMPFTIPYYDTNGMTRIGSLYVFTKNP